MGDIVPDNYNSYRIQSHLFLSTPAGLSQSLLTTAGTEVHRQETTDFPGLDNNKLTSDQTERHRQNYLNSLLYDINRKFLLTFTMRTIKVCIHKVKDSFIKVVTELNSICG